MLHDSVNILEEIDRLLSYLRESGEKVNFIQVSKDYTSFFPLGQYKGIRVVASLSGNNRLLIETN